MRSLLRVRLRGLWGLLLKCCVHIGGDGVMSVCVMCRCVCGGLGRMGSYGGVFERMRGWGDGGEEGLMGRRGGLRE